MCVCECFLPFILGIRIVGRTSRGHTGGRSQMYCWCHSPNFMVRRLQLPDSRPQSPLTTPVGWTAPFPDQGEEIIGEIAGNAKVLKQCLGHFVVVEVTVEDVERTVVALVLHVAQEIFQLHLLIVIFVLISAPREK